MPYGKIWNSFIQNEESFSIYTVDSRTAFIYYMLACRLFCPSSHLSLLHGVSSCNTAGASDLDQRFMNSPCDSGTNPALRDTGTSATIYPSEINIQQPVTQSDVQNILNTRSRQLLMSLCLSHTIKSVQKLAFSRPYVAM